MFHGHEVCKTCTSQPANNRRDKSLSAKQHTIDPDKLPLCLTSIIYLELLFSSLFNMKIEWASSFRPDGTRRRPPPSAMHGWLAKMRGTLLGNEDLRSKGMREMRDARTRKREDSKRKRQHSAKSGKSLFSFLGVGKGGQKKQGAKLQSRRSGGGSTRPSYHSSNSHGSRAVRPPLRPSGTSHRTSQRSQRQDSSRPQASRRSSRR